MGPVYYGKRPSASTLKRRIRISNPIPLKTAKNSFPDLDLAPDLDLQRLSRF
jgi:hypothetical protein